MLDSALRSGAVNYGYSFNSKKVAVAPMFFNLRLMCDALGKAVLRHIQFAQQYSLKPDSLQSSGSDFDDGVLWFLD